MFSQSIRLNRRNFGLAAFSVGAGAILGRRTAAAQALLERLDEFLKGNLMDLDETVREEVAKLLGLEVYVYGFPLVIMDLTKAVMTAASSSGAYSAPINQFTRMVRFVNPSFKNVVRISRNGLWNTAFVDLDEEPFIASVPEITGRYYVMQAMNMWTDNFMSVGPRTTGTGAGNFLIAGPKWSGQLPRDVKGIYHCSTRYAWVLTQTMANGPSDFPAVIGHRKAVQPHAAARMGQALYAARECSGRRMWTPRPRPSTRFKRWTPEPSLVSLRY